MFRFEIIAPQQTLEQLLQSGLRLETNRSLFVDLQNEQPSQETAADEETQEESKVEENKPEPIVVGPRVGRNDLCPCGSGKKFKKCCNKVEIV
ncbi:SEC-C metal-binding domain-containing protein [Candidatus Protochlamydia sp. R18]